MLLHRNDGFVTIHNTFQKSNRQPQRTLQLECEDTRSALFV
jgi:hypothetical protein